MCKHFSLRKLCILLLRFYLITFYVNFTLGFCCCYVLSISSLISYLKKTDERRTTSGNAGTRATPLPPNDVGKSSTVSSNGSKHSKFLRPDNERSNCPHWDPGLDSNWLCSHYKRHCYVKFDCCDKFWPCHRCHNNQSTCGRKKLKSRDTRMLKCVYCNKVQQVTHIFAVNTMQGCIIWRTIRPLVTENFFGSMSFIDKDWMNKERH